MDLFRKAGNFIDKVSHNLSHKEGANGWSVICGGFGGGSFEYMNPNYSLVAVRGKYGQEHVESIQFLFKDIQTGLFQESPTAGGTAGSMFNVNCPPGQWISKIYVWSNKFIDAIQFQTNMGQKTAKFGGPGGSLKIIDSTGKRICGVKGRCGAWMDQLCFAITS